MNKEKRRSTRKKFNQSIISSVVTTFRVIEGNARIMILTEPLYQIPMACVFFYAPLLMKNLGMTELEIGIISSLSILIGVFSQIPGAYLADKWGRKRTYLIFDSIGWLSYTLIWFLARDIRHAIIATLLGGLFNIAMPAWQCLVIEDTHYEARALVLGLLQLIRLLGLLTTPIAGILVSIYGIDIGCRIMYLVAFVSLCIMYLLRAFHLKEPSISMTLAQEEDVISYGKAFTIMITNRRLFILLILDSILLFQIRVEDPFFTLYLTDPHGLGLNKAMISLVPFVSALVQIAVILLLLPRVRSAHFKRVLLISYLITSGSILFLVLMPPKSLLLVLVYAMLRAIPTPLIGSLQQAMRTNIIDTVEPRAMAKVLAITSTMTSLFALIAGPLEGFLFQLNPKWPFCLSLVLRILSCLLTLGL